jgi:transcriptional regulator with XRE-family HTH domain
MNIEIANRLVELRKKNGLSQEQLADKLGLSRQAISKWERAEASPDTDNLICLAKLYGVSLDELLQSDQPLEEIAAQEKEQTEEASPKDSKAEEDKKEETLTPEEIKYAEERMHLKKIRTAENFCDPIFWVLTALAYCTAAAITGLWHPLWLIFFIPVCLSPIFDCLKKKTWAWGGYPILVTGIYLMLGFLYGLWHPYWFLFITIPVFYSFAELLNFLTKSGKYDKDRKLRRLYYKQKEKDDKTDEIEGKED